MEKGRRRGRCRRPLAMWTAALRFPALLCRAQSAAAVLHLHWGGCIARCPAPQTSALYTLQSMVRRKVQPCHSIIPQHTVLTVTTLLTVVI